MISKAEKEYWEEVIPQIVDACWPDPMDGDLNTCVLDDGEPLKGPPGGPWHVYALNLGGPGLGTVKAIIRENGMARAAYKATESAGIEWTDDDAGLTAKIMTDWVDDLQQA